MTQAAMYSIFRKKATINLPAILRVLGLLLIMEAVFMLAYRRKKRASMYVSFFLIALIYITVLAYAHMISGNGSPACNTGRAGTSGAFVGCYELCLETVPR